MTDIKLYRAMTDAIEPVALDTDPVTVYVCGITPYATTHLGHAFTYAVADHLIRFLEYMGHDVLYVQNVTDIDDDILRQAAEVREDWRTLGNRWTTHFIQDLQRLNVRPPDHFPRASEFIPQMIQGIEILLEHDMAYATNGSVYYRAECWSEFGSLSGLAHDELLPTANERGNIADDPNKRDPLDFPLWQAQKPGEPAWDSPWGPGRPGWHIECSTMAIELLGETVDFHGGGSDLTFPHHECEIAQAEPVTGVSPFVRSWFHAAMVEYEGEKMSKSLGNLIMARDLLLDYTPDALRLYLASHHYRSTWSYRRQDLHAAAEMAERWTRIASRPTADPSAVYAEIASNGFDSVTGAHSTVAQPTFALPVDGLYQFTAAMAQDLDTPAAIEVLDQLVDRLAEAAQNGLDIAEAQRLFQHAAAVLGLRLTTTTLPEPEVIRGWNRHMKQFAEFTK